jgi:hypothetical protein
MLINYLFLFLISGSKEYCPIYLSMEKKKKEYIISSKLNFKYTDYFVLCYLLDVFVFVMFENMKKIFKINITKLQILDDPNTSFYFVFVK